MPEEYRQVQKRPMWPIIVVAALLVCLIACGVTLIVLYLRDEPSPSPEGPATGQNTPQTTGSSPSDPDVTGPADTDPPENRWTAVQKKRADIHTGDLILVNYEHEYVFPSFDAILPFYGNKTAPYKLRNSEVAVRQDVLNAFNELIQDYYEKTGVDDIIVISAYRDYEFQKNTYSDYVEEHGVAAAEKYVAKPGFSEHHTGLCVDLGIYTDDGVMLEIGEEETYTEFLNACVRHGFILRYETEKYSLTRIYGEEWHFRYVGFPHAYYMSVRNLCLEEYIPMLSTFPYDGDHLFFTDSDEQNWEIYYVPAQGSADTDLTSVPVPADAPYTVSGNNIDGFIVTVQR